VTGTGTDVGKTVVTAGLVRAARDAGLDAQVVKAVQTGCSTAPDGTVMAPDIEVCRRACPQAPCSALELFPEPCSPHLAARRSGGALSAAALADALRRRAETGSVVIVEGAGGLLVPLNDSETMADVLMLLDARVALVVPNRLGAINHALLAIESLRMRGIEPAAVVFTSPDAEETDPLEEAIRKDNIETIRRMGRVDCVAALPHYPALARAGAETEAAAWEDIAARLSGVAARLRDAASGESFDIAAFDAGHLWHPYAATTPPPHNRVAAKTRGARIVLDDGRALVDGMSSWWSAIHGYNHPALLDALRRQAAVMPHVMFGGLTHAPAARLGKRLLALAPDGLERVFLCDSGSVACEVALKMALQCQRARGNAGRTRILAPLGGYHGDTIGAMSVSDPVNGMHTLFGGILPRQVFFDRQACPFGGDFRPETLESMEAAFRLHGSELAAAIIEPVVQGAGGMWLYHPEYLRRLRELCDKYGVLLIFDEIATAFGRTGKMFACEWAGASPDILCVGKALTGGVMTLAAVLAREDVASAISRTGAFMHGPTFMANPLACAVACASLDLLASTPWRERVARMEEGLRAGLLPCRDMEGVADVRVLGGIGVVEMRAPVNAARLQRFFVDECGVWIRPFSRLIYVMPPYVSEAEDIALLTRSMIRAVKGKKWE
jgi:adenosylmethionine-8-amino-7-oxononanoate aminotransferase